MKITICTRPTETKGQSKVFANLVRDILVGGLVWVVTYLVIRAFYTGWNLADNSTVQFWIPVVALTLSLVLAESPWRRWACIGYTVILAGQVLLFFSRIKQGVGILWNVIISWIHNEYGVSLPAMALNPELPQEETYLMVIVVQVLCLLLLLGLRNRGFWCLWLFLSIVLACGSLSVNECPDTKLLIGFAVTVFVLLVVRGFLEAPASKTCMYIVCTAVFFAMLAAGITSVLEEEDYKQFVKDRDYRKEFYTFVNDVVLKLQDKGVDIDGDSEFGSEVFGSMGMAGGELPTDVSGITATGEVHLLVTLPKNSPATYLRAYVGSKYINNAWHEVDNFEVEDFLAAAEKLNSGIEVSTYTNLLNYRFFLNEAEVGFSATPYSFEQYYSSVIVQNIGASKKYVYAPYVTSENPAVVGDANGYWKPSGKGASIVYYQQIYNELGVPFHYSFDTDASFDLWQLQGTSPYYFSEFDALYREFVYNYYLSVPRECQAVAKILTPEGNLQTDVARVIEYLLTNYEYTTKPGKLPRGEDAISYFMWKSGKGYCMHFASAAVMMLRGMGIPARYVEGYVIRESSIENGVSVGEAQGVRLEKDGQVSTVTQEYVEVEVKDSAAHAWVEIYIDGYGWFPIDATPLGYTEIPDLSVLATPTPTPTNSARPTSGVVQGATKTPTPTPTRAVIDANTSTPTPTKAQSGGGIPEATKTPTPQAGGATVTPGILIPDTTISDLQEPGQGNEQSSETGGTFLRSILTVFGVLLACVLLLYLRYRYLRGVRYMRCRSKYARKAVKAYFMEIRGLLPYWGVRQEKWEDDATFSERAAEHLPQLPGEYDITEVAATALRAAFSKEKVEDEERKGIAKYYHLLRSATLQKLPIWKRLYVKYLQCR